MIRWAFALLVCVLAGCTGQNVDEDFVFEHGGTLAEVVCKGSMTRVNSDAQLSFQAEIFMDDSTFVSSRVGPIVGTYFFSRGNRPAHTLIQSNDTYNGCSTGSSAHLKFDSGELQYFNCEGSPPASSLQATYDVTNCTGFNKSLFD